MLNRRVATILRIACERPGAQEVVVDVGGVQAQAINYPDLSGPVAVGDEVLLNTTAVDLHLGTGGFHFVICNLSNPVGEPEASVGHIMKLRYTPAQKSVPAVEEDQLGHGFDSLGGMPVICCELHSQIAPAAAAFKACSKYRARLSYIMTDGAALPLGFSRLVAELRQKGILDATITCGQAFGGEIEAINLFSALIAAKQFARADAVVVCQGPGNAGAETKYGFSGIHQGETINAASILGGTAIAVLRMSFADERERHRGVSHHTRTVLGEVALRPALIPVPGLDEDKARFVNEQLKPIVARAGHETRPVDGEIGIEELRRRDVRVKTMGRSVDEDREFFLAASAAGVLAADIVKVG